MGAQLNIKSEDAHRPASRRERERDVEAEVDRVLALAKEIPAHMGEPVSSDTSGMYDENGLPK
jgi:hypothetical protein